MIEINGLQFAYASNGFVLQISELRIESGQKIAIIGPSGCGKTTLANLIAGILPLQQGRLIIDDIEPAQLTDAQLRRFRITRIGFIFQAFELMDYLNVRENILLPGYIHPALQPNSGLAEHACLLAERVGLGDKLLRHPSELSQGECQRVAICRALINQPAILIADEPTGNLDPVATQEIMRLMHSEVDKHGCTWIMITHDHSLLNSFDTVIDMQTFLTTAVA